MRACRKSEKRFLNSAAEQNLVAANLQLENRSLFEKQNEEARILHAERVAIEEASAAEELSRYEQRKVQFQQLRELKEEVDVKRTALIQAHEQRGRLRRLGEAIVGETLELPPPVYLPPPPLPPETLEPIPLVLAELPPLPEAVDVPVTVYDVRRVDSYETIYTVTNGEVLAEPGTFVVSSEAGDLYVVTKEDFYLKFEVVK